MVLAMVVVGGLVGPARWATTSSPGFAQREDFGKGLAAGIAIVLLGIMLDRITQGAGRRGRRARRDSVGRRRRTGADGQSPRSGRVADRPRRNARMTSMEVDRGALARSSRRRALAVAGAAPAAGSGGGERRRRREGHGQDRHQPVGRRRGQRRGRRLPAREPARLQGRDKDLAEELAWQGFETGEVDAILENWGHPDSKVHHRQEGRRRTPARTGVNGIIGWYVPQWMADRVSGHHRLEQPQQVRRPVQDLRVRRQGPVPRRRPVVRHERRGADHEPGPELQGRLLRQRGRADQAFQHGHRAEQDAADRLLLRPAVVPQRDQARQGQAAGLHGRAATPTRRRSPATTRRTP